MDRWGQRASSMRERNLGLNCSFGVCTSKRSGVWNFRCKHIDSLCTNTDIKNANDIFQACDWIMPLLLQSKVSH